MESALNTRPSLIQGLKQNNEFAWQKFHQLYLPLVESWLRKFGVAPADMSEVVSEFVYKCFGAMRNFEYDPPRKFRRYLRKVAKSAWIDVMKRNARHPMVLRLQDISVEPMTKNLTDELTMRLDLDYAETQVQSQFSDKQWDSWRLWREQGLSGKEIANRHNIQVGKVYAIRRLIKEAVRSFVSSF